MNGEKIHMWWSCIILPHFSLLSSHLECDSGLLAALSSFATTYATFFLTFQSFSSTSRTESSALSPRGISAKSQSLFRSLSLFSAGSGSDLISTQEKPSMVLPITGLSKNKLPKSTHQLQYGSNRRRAARLPLLQLPANVHSSHAHLLVLVYFQALAQDSHRWEIARHSRKWGRGDRRKEDQLTMLPFDLRWEPFYQIILQLFQNIV